MHAYKSVEFHKLLSMNNIQTFSLFVEKFIANATCRSVSESGEFYRSHDEKQDAGPRCSHWRYVIVNAQKLISSIVISGNMENNPFLHPKQSLPSRNYRSSKMADSPL